MATIVVTGASKGLGLAITTYLLKENERNRLIVCCNTDDKSLKALASESGNENRVFIIKGDTADANFAKTVFSQSLVHFEIDRIDALVLNHGVLGDGKRLADSTQEDWEKCFRVNVFSYVGVVRYRRAGNINIHADHLQDSADHTFPKREPRPNHHDIFWRLCLRNASLGFVQ
jgi:NAD(P)-dependent dehydrogenase (short-subunit alcohol dehydrogenase family)